MLITCAGILTRDVEPIDQVQLFLFSSEIAFEPTPAAAKRRLFTKMKVSIVIPCYNEKDTIEKVVEAVCKAPLKSREIIVVDDCSKDGTQPLLRERLSSVVDRIIYHPVNQVRERPCAAGSPVSTSVRLRLVNMFESSVRNLLLTCAKRKGRDVAARP
jgi:cellulose synthase/poly-beta-1,6-N-acetylglucosamine synthase-like glycosyltransferase